MFKCALLSLKALSYHDTQNQVTLAGKNCREPLRNRVGFEGLQFFPKDLINSGEGYVCWGGLCLTVAIRSLGFLMVQSVKAAFLREAGTAGTSAPTTCGANTN